jgi:DNA phosphorothioation-dependent restriction protein DptH
VIDNSKLVDSLAEHLVDRYLKDISEGKVIQIVDIQMDLATKLNIRCLEILGATGNFHGSMITLSKRKNAATYEEKAEVVVELRNQHKHSLVVFIPQEYSRTTQSIASFKSLSIPSIMEEQANKILKELENDNAFMLNKSLSTLLSKNKSIEDWLLLLLECKESREPLNYFASNLWRLDLIPDVIEQTLDIEKLSENVQVCRTLSTRSNPMQTPVERFDELGLIKDGQWEELRNLLIKNKSNLFNWKKAIFDSNNKNLLFSNWKFKSGIASAIHSLEMQAFVGASGKVDKTSGVVRIPSGDFIAEKGFVKIKWVMNPVRVDADFNWKIEVMSSIDHDVEEADAEAVIRKTQFSFKANFENLLGERIEEYFGRRICLRVSAIDETGTTLTKVDGQLAQIYSEPFILVKDVSEDPTHPGSSGSTKVLSIAEVGLLAVIDNNVKDVEQLEGPFVTTLNISDQTLTVYLNSMYTVEVNSYLMRLQDQQFSNPEKSYSYVDVINRIYPNGYRLESKEIVGLPEDFVISRKNFFQSFSTESDGTKPYLETVFWDSNLITKLEDYVSNYLKLIRSENLDPETRNKLLSLDTLEIQIETNSGMKSALVLPSLHPLRAMWLKDYSLALREIAKKLMALAPSERRKNIDLNLVRQVLPINYPFVVTKGKDAFVHAFEASFGTGVFLNLQDRDNLQMKESIQRILNIQRTEKYNYQIATRMTEHILSYLNTTEQAMGIRISLFNAGTAALAAEAISRVRAHTSSEGISNRFNITGYSAEDLGVNELKSLKLLAEKINRESLFEGGLFRPELSIRVNELSELDDSPEATNISILHGASKSEISTQGCEVEKYQRDGLFNGLITYLFSYSLESEDGITHFTTPTVHDSKKSLISLPNLHQAFSRMASGSDYGFALKLPLGLQQIALIDQIHSLSDWVLTLDTFIGPALYEDVLNSTKSGIVVIDYSPEFVDGFGDRLTLTTTKYFEITRILSRAMLDLGLEDQGITARDVLRGLSSISGRLAMRLLGNNSLATEAVGLFAVYQYLNSKDLLQDSIIIPIDAHQEIFSPKRHDEQRDNDRCDLLLVKIKDDVFEISFVEVKTRRSRFIDDLPATMATQIENTSEWLRHLLFDSASQRVDQSLQWSRWASLLHFYADRSRLHGLISSNDIGEVHSKIADICERRLRPTKIINKGFIVCLDFEGSLPDLFRLNMELEIINESRVRELSFVTTREMTEKGTEVNSEQSEVVPLRQDLNSDTSELLPSNELNTTVQFPLLGVIEKMETQESTEVEVNELKNTSQVKSEQPRNQEVGTQLNDLETPKEFQIHLGMDTADQSVDWKLSVKGSPHGLIAGVSGHGKSVTTRNIVKGFAEARIPTIIFDFHGEMAEISGVELNVIDVGAEGLPFSPFGFNREVAMPVSSAAQEISEILRNIGGLGDIQHAHVRTALLNIYDAKNLTDQNSFGEELPTMEDFVRELEIIQSNNRGKNALERLNWFTSFGLFRASALKKFDALDARGSVFDLSRYSQEEVKLTAGSFILKKIYNEMFLWGKSDRLKLSLILDEAHRLASDPTIPKLMKEGRKYGVSLLLASQNLDDFAPEVVQNAGLRIAFRNNHPASRKIAALLNQRDSMNLAQQIEKLDVGWAFVITETTKNTRKTRMRSIDN